MSKSSYINVTSLIALADTTTTAEVKKEFNLDLVAPDIKEALIEIKAEEKKAAARAAAKEIYSLLEIAQAIKVEQVQKIRAARNQVDASKANLDAIAAAEKYASETNNYLPLCKALSLPIFGAPSGLCSIPEKAASKATRK